VPRLRTDGTSVLWPRMPWKLLTEQTTCAKNGIKLHSRMFSLTDMITHTEDTNPMTKKYFPNNYNKIKNCPPEWFEPMEYDLFMEWKMNGWVLMDTHDCIIRARDCVTGKVTEYSYQVPKYAKERLKKLITEHKHELILCTHDHIQHLKPEEYITEHDEENFYPK